MNIAARHGDGGGLAGNGHDIHRLHHQDLTDPHALLGPHWAVVGGREGTAIRAYHPDANGCVALVAGSAGEPPTEYPLQTIGGGYFAVFIPGADPAIRYSLRWWFQGGTSWDSEDPYRFLPTVGELDTHLFNSGDHRQLWTVLGSHVREIDGVRGTSFAVWAPNARSCHVMGDFSNWDRRRYAMRLLGTSGVWEVFIPGIEDGTLYKFVLKTREGWDRIKTDPFAYRMEQPPAQGSIVHESQHLWGDTEWMEQRKTRDFRSEPMSIYEVHIGSWARVPEEGDRYLNYRELAPKLAAHCKRFSFTHVELMPVAEHAFYPSWGYQVTGYYAPTSRYGTPDDFKYLVDYLHQQGIGLIVDWVPAHFPKDDFSLRRFDGTALYEHEDARRGEHPDWGTLIFNFGRNEVKNFLVANALFWLSEFHVDGLRVDAVASMLYLDYSRKAGEWIPNQYGGRENIEAIEFLKAFNYVVHKELPGTFTVAEESTSWFGVTKDVADGGLGFTFKWNMGWMHDTLVYFSKEPVHRKWHQDQLTFSMIYEYSEAFINSISHDEVVHGKRSLLEKMPGDIWQKLANVRTLLAYEYFRPGKQLIFMGTELGDHAEWNFDASLPWHLEADPARQKLQDLLAELGRLYLTLPCLWKKDHSPEGFEWLDCTDRENSVLAFVRRNGPDHVIVLMNLTPVPRSPYRVGSPTGEVYTRILSTDEARFGGSDYGVPETVEAELVPCHGREHSILLTLPPLGVVVLQPDAEKTKARAARLAAASTVEPALPAPSTPVVSTTAGAKTR